MTKLFGIGFAIIAAIVFIPATDNATIFPLRILFLLSSVIIGCGALILFTADKKPPRMGV